MSPKATEPAAAAAEPPAADVAVAVKLADLQALLAAAAKHTDKDPELDAACAAFRL
jgi:hypothetical protein